MSKKLYEESNIQAIADAIRSKTGKTDLLFPANMASEILNIVAGGGSPSNITVSEIVMETTVTNGGEAKTYIDSLVTTNNTTLFLNKKLIQEEKTFVDAEAIAIFYMRYSNYDGSGLASKYFTLRNREGASSAITLGNAQYDFYFNIGDEFLMIVFS